MKAAHFAIQSGNRRKSALEVIAGKSSRRSKAASSCSRTQAPKVLAVVAHPDDEYSFAATVYKIARELGGTVDQVVVTNGEGGFRYAALAETIYGLPLTREDVGRSCLPDIRKNETIAAGRILGIRRHYFLDQKDPGYTLDRDEVRSQWDNDRVRSFLIALFEKEEYQYVFTLLPAADTHGHHQAATILALEAADHIRSARRPVVLGMEPMRTDGTPRQFTSLAGAPLTNAGSDIHDFNRTRRFGFQDALSYSIVVNWVIAEHKSQGLFQTEAGQHDVERFWRFEVSGEGSEFATRSLFQLLNATNESTADLERTRRYA